MRLEHERLEPELAQPLVAAGVLARGRRRAPPRTTRGSSRCGRSPARRSRRTGRGCRLEKLKSVHEAVDARRTDPRASAVRRPDRRRASRPRAACRTSAARAGSGRTYDPCEVASIDGFRRDPERVWEFYGRRLACSADVEPNAAHHALAELEAAGLVRRGDHAERRRPARARRLAGRDRGARLARGARVCPALRARRAAARRVAAAPAAPALPGCGAVLKPDVVMFGELLPDAALDRAIELAAAAALLLVVGSSLEVWPVAGLPEETLRRGGRRRDGQPRRRRRTTSHASARDPWRWRGRCSPGYGRYCWVKDRMVSMCTVSQTPESRRLEEL